MFRFRITLTTKIMLVIFILFLSFSISFANTIFEFHFSQEAILPSSYSGIIFNNNDYNKIESELFFAPGGLLQQRTLNSSGNSSYKSEHNVILDSSLSLNMQVRCKVTSIEGYGGYFQALDGLYRYTVQFVKDNIAITTNDGAVMIPVDISVFHTYEIKSPGNSSFFEIIIDNTVVFEGQAQNYSQVNGFGWGDGTTESGNGADIDWDFVTISQASKLYSQAEVDHLIQGILNWGDMNNDGKIGLDEAIKALQITVNQSNK